MSGSPNETTAAAARGIVPRQGPASVNRTCEPCRRRKIKCILPPIDDDAAILNEKQCIRCRKLCLDCVFLPPATKRTRKRNENRIRDLERKLDAIQDAVEGNQQQFRPSPSSVPTSYEHSPLSTGASQQSSGSTNLIEDDFAGQLNALVDDPITRGLVTYDTARQLYSDFCEKVAPLYPVVLPPPSSTWEDVRVKKPALFRAAITAAASSFDAKLSEILFQDTEKMVAEKIIFSGEKSLELLQALLILSTWYHPPRNFRGLKFTQLANLAATMVLDLRSSNDSRYKAKGHGSRGDPFADSIEVSRTFAACFLLCSSMAMSLRRPSMLVHGPWVDWHIETLSSMDSPLLHDRRLIAWVRLQVIGEDGSRALNLNDDDCEDIDISDSQTQFILRGCVQRLVAWTNSTEPDVKTSTLDTHYQMIMATFHEASFYTAHSPADFRPPYTLRLTPLKSNRRHKSPSVVDRDFMTCIHAARGLVQDFLQFDIPTTQVLPVVVYTRLAYGAIVLIKAYISLRGDPRMFSSLHNLIVTPPQLLRPVLDKLRLASEDGRVRVPTVFHFALSNVAQWFEHGLEDGDNDLIEPMMHLGIDKERDAPRLHEEPRFASQGGSQIRTSDAYLVGPGPFPSFEHDMSREESWINVLPDGPAAESFDTAFEFNFGD